MTIRHIDAEITFSGLCLIHVKESEGTERPPRAKTVEVLLVKAIHGCTHGAGGGEAGATRQSEQDGSVANTYQGESGPTPQKGHPHYPRLTYFLHDHPVLRPGFLDWDGRLLPSPDGREVVSHCLAGKHVAVIPPFDYHPEWSELRWCNIGEDSPLPRSVAEDTCLDWLIDGDLIRLKEIHPELATTVVSLPNGVWETHGVTRNREVASLEPILWKIGEDTDERKAPIKALARDIVLRLHDLRHGLTVRISDLATRDDPHDIVLTPGPDDHLKFAISNLPVALSEAEGSHVGMFQQLTRDQDQLAAIQFDDVVCMQPDCKVMVAFGGK